MKRFLLILFVMLLPLQSVWAAVDIYCQSEVTSNGAHCADDCLLKQASDSSSPDGKNSVSHDGDCSPCHAGHSLALSGLYVLGFATADLPPIAFAHFPSLLSPTARPERPNWYALA
ncbi:hypothetical protein Q9Q94_08005 [Uliginosibacterium sp. 31-16]|uniref:hypothetical protein n=1 Tax=Uliginosibacterium sp. 31-16 TaxID=3068315 RepID=UPI00273EB449|nr:hypothetical protein [Uliginosibacterium sp. 31-16]MDP5239469.1 hypothetical protein [Uliginosibacterium sp. 31-16]